MIYIAILFLAVLILCDMLTLRKVYKEKALLEAMRDWCVDSGVDPKEYVKAITDSQRSLKNTKGNVINESK